MYLKYCNAVILAVLKLAIVLVALPFLLIVRAIKNHKRG